MESIIVGVISALVSLVGVFVSANATQSKIANEIKTQNELQSAEILRIKDDIKEMKADIKEHNSYGKKFVELKGDFLVVENRQTNVEHRVATLESYHERS